MLLFRFIITFFITTRIGLNSLMLKKYFSFLIPSSAAALYFPLCLKHCLRQFKALPLNTKPALTGQLTHTSANTANNNMAVVLNHFLQAK